MANGLNTIIIKRDIISSSNNNNNFQKDNNNLIKIEQSLKVNNNNNNTMIKREIIDSNNSRIINNNTLLKSQQNLLNNKSITASSSSVVVSPSGGSATNNNNNTLTCGNTKMGSRRIFTPQFKLQVLESYRNDNDCKGNQRATARKYGIHRRQIQKWLQCESNLRSSVANLNNQNNNNNNVIIKHQFHNISHNNHSQQQQSILTNLNSSNNNQQYNKISSSTNNATANNVQMSLDSARHSVALNSIQTLSPSLSISSSSTTVAAIPSMAATTTQSSMAGVAITTSSSSPISIRSPIQINCNNVGKSILQHHHQQQNTMPYLTNTPAINTSVSVPIPIVPTHSSTATAAAAAAYYHQYHLQLQHHNDIVTSHNQHNHHQQHHHQQQQNENRMPSSVSLPIPTAATAIHQHHNYHNATINTTSAPIIATATTNQTNELRDYLPIYTATTGNQITLSSNYEEFAITSRQSSQQEQPKTNYENLYNDNHDYYQMQPIHHQPQSQQYEYIDITSVTSSPIDLSLSHKKDRNTCNDEILDRRNLNYDDKKIIKLKDYTKLIISKQEIETNNNYNEENNIKNNDDSLIVDLSCRKRKNSNDKYEMPQEKVQKICDNITTTSSISNNNNNDQSEENDQQQNQQQPKPVKLFKPYLLDDNIVDDNQVLKKSDQQDPIIWSHHPSSNYDSQCSSRGSNFHGGSPIEYPFPVGSPTFSNQHYQQSHIITSSAIQSPCASASADSCCNRSTIVQSPISSVPPISPRSPGTTATTQTNSTFWCPKGSPVSGYDTASTYSDCSDYYKTTTKDITCRNYLGEQQQQQRITKPSPAVTYTIDLKMHTVDNYYTNHNSQSGNLIRSRSDTDQFISQNGLYRNHHVQRWLDHDSAADVRQGIAVYV